ncbi:MAG: hypothetical protein H0V57_07105 [Thermoleophilaceae bacterium]|nr:hypothetical protein [Thermoleophilaceae bacterium]
MAPAAEANNPMRASQGPTASFTATPNPELTNQTITFDPAASTRVDGTIPNYPSPQPLEMLSPFPIVRIIGRLVRRGAYISRLSVRAPGGTKITVRCRGRRCPYRRASVRLNTGRAVRFRRLQRRFRARTLIEVLVTHPTKIGKYTGFRIRRGRSPRRRDLCLVPGAGGPTECPSG